MRARQRERLAVAFESIEDKTKRKNEKVSGAAKKSSVGNFDKMNWDKEAMKEEVLSYADDKVVNWSEIARYYNIRNSNGAIAQNGGQIAQEWLKSIGIDVGRLKRKSPESDVPCVRRKRLKGPGGEITIPTPSTNKSLTEQLKEKILSGEYSMGELIVPKKVFF